VRPRPGVLALIVLVATRAAFLLIPRALEWASEPKLWAATYERDRAAPDALANRGYMLLDEGHAAEAIAEAEALTADPLSAADAHSHLGILIDRCRQAPLQRRVAVLERGQASR